MCCGDNRVRPPDAFEPPHDAEVSDAPPLPRPPAIGAQIDRMGRPAISTALIALRDASGEPREPARVVDGEPREPARIAGAEAAGQPRRL